MLLGRELVLSSYINCSIYEVKLSQVVILVKLVANISAYLALFAISSMQLALLRYHVDRLQNIKVLILDDGNL